MCTKLYHPMGIYFHIDKLCNKNTICKLCFSGYMMNQWIEKHHDSKKVKKRIAREYLLSRAYQSIESINNEYYVY